MTDTVTLLRSPPSHMGLDNWQVLCNRAADEIERLRAKLAEYETVLSPNTYPSQQHEDSGVTDEATQRVQAEADKVLCADTWVVIDGQQPPLKDADAALKRMEARKDENAEEWAENLAADLSKFKD